MVLVGILWYFLVILEVLWCLMAFLNISVFGGVECGLLAFLDVGW